MRVRISVLLLTVAGCFLFASPARATDYAYGYTSVYVDGTVVRGYHRTEVDYNTDVYYRPYVCASLYKNGIEVVRACGGGFASATRNTQTPYFGGSSYSALTDHYVNIEYEEEDPYNPGYYYYSDVLGYGFSPSGSHPIDWYFPASGFYNQRPDESVHLGDTNAQLQTPQIDSISPDRGSINATVGISIIGTGFGSGSTVSVDGTGVTGSVQSFSSTSLSVTLTIAANAVAGNHGVKVTRSGKTSSSVNFFVQLLTRLRRDSISGLTNEPGGCGATKALTYQLLDQEGAEINSGGTLKETISNFSGPVGLKPPDATNTQMTSGRANDTVGYHILSCPPPFTATLTQTFTVVLGSQSYALTSSNAISMGRTSAGSKFVNIAFTQ